MYSNSYDLGRKPFKHDKHRGKWRSKWDFYLASIGHSFGLQNFSILAFVPSLSLAVFLVVFFTIYAFLFIIPMYFVQSSIGQFSGTGFISTFRISPLFKGVGYVILFLNILTASYYSVLVAYSLWYFFMSFSPELPWMSCSNEWNTYRCHNSTYFWQELPSEYFYYKVLQNDESIIDSSITHIVWPILGCSMLVWILVYFCNRNGVKSIGPFIRYTTISSLTILFIFFIRGLFLPSTWEKVWEFSSFDWTVFTMPGSYMLPLVYAFPIIGSGWGTVMTMSSYNDFKFNTITYSITIPLAMFALTLISGLFSLSAYWDLQSNHQYHAPENSFRNYFLFVYEIFPLFFGTNKGSHLWSLLFYLMMFLLEINALMIQVFTVLTSIFDEYEILRCYKKVITIVICATLALAAFPYATNFGYYIYLILMPTSVFLQMFICFLELMIVVWIYGRIKFQRDMEFMLGRKIKTWIFYIIRLITPLFSLFFMVVLPLVFISVFVLEEILPTWCYILILAVVISPFLFILGHIIYQISITIGTIPNRFRKCLQPTDWYPSSFEDRQAYDQALNRSEISHQILETNEESNGIQNGLHIRHT